jgi:hypothetical protein
MLDYGYAATRLSLLESKMTGDVANLLLEELRALRHGQEALRHGQEALRADIADVKISAQQSETVPGLAFNLVSHLQLQIASQTMRIDRFDERLNHIARRIEMANA